MRFTEQALITIIKKTIIISIEHRIAVLPPDIILPTALRTV